MTDLHVLIWALSLLFCMAMGFVILLWCRSWRREEREASERHIENLSREISRLAVAVDGMDETAASLLAADEQIAADIEKLSEQVRLLSGAGGTKALPAEPAVRPTIRTPGPQKASGTADTRDLAPEPEQASPEPSPRPAMDRYQDARKRLQQGQSELDVARDLQMGAAEVRMIARMMERPQEASKKGD